jgi:hypothetical protein
VSDLGYLRILEKTLLNRKCSASLKMEDQVKVPFLSDPTVLCYMPK